MIQLKNIVEINITREYCKRSFYNFFKLIWDSVETVQYVDNWHIKLLCDELQKRQFIWEKQSNGEIIDEEAFDILVNICPSASKSLIISVAFPAWILLRNPRVKILNTTYSYSISEKLASKRSRLFTSDLYQKLMEFKIKNLSLSNFENDLGGSIFATSVGGSLTGTHYDVLLIDDGNSPQSIYSEPARQEANRFISEILPSRKTNVKRSYTIYVQQRFHQEDISGTLLSAKNGKKLKHIVIPAIENGKSFFEERFPISYFDQIREQLGSIQFAAQYMQVTQDDAGGIIRKDWLKEIEGDSTQKLTYFLDSAYGGDKADDNAIIGVYKASNNLVIQMCHINKMEFPELIKWMKINIPSNSKIYIEGKASGKSIIQTLKRETNFNILETQPKGSKLERKHSISPFFESGRVFINKFIDNKQKLTEQLIFDNSKHDDISDTVTMSIEQLLKIGGGNYNLGFI